MRYIIKCMALSVLAACFAAGPAAAPEGDDHALVKVVEAHRAAKRAGDTEKVLALQSEDARIWFEKKEGEGAKLKAGGGPWSEWDRFFNAKSERLGDYQVEDRTVTALYHEINDYFRLLDRPGGKYYATYYFDNENRVGGLLIHGTGEERDMGRYDEFVAWAKENRPGVLDELMPDGELDPALDKAKLWKKTLTAWRAGAGLAPIE